jgi:hypothetical protein
LLAALRRDEDAADTATFDRWISEREAGYAVDSLVSYLFLVRLAVDERHGPALEIER